MKKIEITTVKTEDGKEINVSGFKKSLVDYPQRYRAMMSDDGHPYIMGLVYKNSPCGCTITGNGTLQFPVKIVHCEKHRI